MKDKQLYYFEQSPIFKGLMHFSLPMMMGSLLSVIYGILNGIGFLLTGLLQTTGQERGSTIMALEQGLIIIPVLFVLDNYFGLTGVVWSLLVVETLCSLLAMFIVYVSRHHFTVDTAALLE